ncbi:hypothetical protein J3R30DRAFT_3753763 [Lentinula aciculospora]|uniref:Uncharacterized protein n=1 Tax=Lentinula aciculospora TaxID=153920 RepID=A0A9W9DXD1_9AGAR|nr:hypothetical protein J3R30DRAFT_3753763 [Lentinula aciculospora]
MHIKELESSAVALWNGDDELVKMYALTEADWQVMHYITYDIGPKIIFHRDGNPHIGLAIGIVNGLLTLLLKNISKFAGRKNGMENEISSAIEGIKDRLPGLKMYQAIYTGNNELEIDLQKKILFAYLAFIDQSMEITKYSVQSGYHIKLCCEELIGLWIDTLVHGMNALKSHNEELQWDQNTTHLIEIQNALNLASWTPENHRKKLLDYKFWLYFEHMKKKYTNKYASMDWSKARLSSVLILQGINNENLNEGKTHNWLSPFALDFAEKLYDNNTNPPSNAVYICDLADSASRALFTALLMVLLQLLWPKREYFSKFDGHYESLMAFLH